MVATKWAVLLARLKMYTINELGLTWNTADDVSGSKNKRLEKFFLFKLKLLFLVVGGWRGKWVKWGLRRWKYVFYMRNCFIGARKYARISSFSWARSSTDQDSLMEFYEFLISKIILREFSKDSSFSSMPKVGWREANKSERKSQNWVEKFSRHVKCEIESWEIFQVELNF